MPGEDFNSTLRFDADITDYTAAMQEATRLAKNAYSEFNVVASTMDDWSSSTDGLTAKLKQLDAQQQVEERRLEIIQEAYEKAVKEKGEYSAAAIKLKTDLNNQQATVNKTAKEHEKFAQKLEEVENGADGAADDVKKAGDAAKQAGEDAKDAGDGWTIFKDVIADFVSNAISGLVDSITGAAEATREYRRDMAQMAQNAADAGVDMGVMKDTLADVASITGEADAAMEGLNMLMASGLDTDGIVLASEALSGAATKFDGVKFEGIAEGLQETLATGAAVGPFAELIERTGGNLETFNEGLAACTTEAERQQYVLKWLADSGLANVHDAYVQNNADLVAAEQAQFRLNDAMASVGAAMEPIQTALTNIGATILEKVAPVIEGLVTWVLDNLPTITPIITGIAVALGVLAAALAIQGIINGVSKAFGALNAVMSANPILLVVSLLAGLVAAFVTAYKTNDEFRQKVDKAWAAIKNGIGSAIDWIGKKIDSLVSWWKALPEKISSAISSTVDKVKTWGTNVYNAAKTKVTETVDGVVSWYKQLPGKIASAISGAVDRVVQWGRDLVSKGKEAASNLVSNMVDVFKSLPGKMLDIGSNLVSGLWNGISNSFQWIKDKISGWVGNVLDFMKNLFGIHSPSDETEWQGEMLVEGYVRALRNGRQRMAEAMQGFARSGLAAMGDVPAEVGGAAGVGGKSISFTQINNSPKALTRREIYRQTHNALAYAGGM